MSDLIPLSQWMSIQPAGIVALRGESALSSALFVERVECWTATLCNQSGQRWAVFHEDAFEFLAILFALWHLNKRACIPGDNCPATVKRLANTVDGFIGQFANSIDPVATQKNHTDNAIKWHELDPKLVALEIYTSGSSGDPKAIEKTIKQLQNELSSLQIQWPDSRGLLVLTTVSHHHLYGLTFRLLRPFCAGQIFVSHAAEYTEEIFHLTSQHSDIALVSSPSHLARINTLLDWQTLTSTCHFVFSSAAPLERAHSLLVSQLLNTPVREIYGSSETGAIAWRSHVSDASNAKWQPLPQVSISTNEEGQATVYSPYNGKDEYQILNDRLALSDDGSFELLGRTDTIVKVEGKRVSLTAIENLLALQPWINQAKALVLSRQRIEIALVIKLTEAGSVQLIQFGRKKLIEQLRTALASDFENTVLPRRWRFVDKMPHNQQGKVSLSALQLVVEQPATTKWPSIENIVEQADSVCLSCQIPAELIYFDGHFADAPILPGVVQVHWAEKFARQFFAIHTKFRKLEVIKFSQIIQPSENITINLKFNQLKHQVSFSYESEKGLHASGRICFE